MYPIVSFDALWGKVRVNGQVAKVAVYLALGTTMAGQKEVLGMWAANTEGAKFWLQVLTELKNRGVRDCFIGCVDGIKAFPQRWRRCFDPYAFRYVWELRPLQILYRLSVTPCVTSPPPVQHLWINPVRFKSQPVG